MNMKKNFIVILVSLLMVFIIACDSAENQEIAELKKQNQILTIQLENLKIHKESLACAQEMLKAIEQIDGSLEAGLTLPYYSQLIAQAAGLLNSMNCPGQQKEKLGAILQYHALAARFWSARFHGQAGDLAADLANTVYPLWKRYHLSPDVTLSKNLEKWQTNPEDRTRIEKIIANFLNNQGLYTEIARAANQALWHQAHEELRQYQQQFVNTPEN